jgi:hypothetical protein
MKKLNSHEKHLVKYNCYKANPINIQDWLIIYLLKDRGRKTKNRSRLKTTGYMYNVSKHIHMQSKTCHVSHKPKLLPLEDTKLGKESGTKIQEKKL